MSVQDAESKRPSALSILKDEVVGRLRNRDGLLSRGLPQAPTCSVMTGAAGVAQGLARIASVTDDPALGQLAWEWALKAEADRGRDDAFRNDPTGITPSATGPVSPYHTLVGVHATLALLSADTGALTTCVDYVRRFLAVSDASCDRFDLTAGRAGTLVACSILVDALPPDAGYEPSFQALRAAGDHALREVWRMLRDRPAVGRSRAGRGHTEARQSLGVAHGWAGVCYATLLWARVSGSRWPSELEERLEQLAAAAESTARGVRWPTHSASPSGYMASWCNGSPGYVHLWVAAYRALGSEGFLRLAELSAQDAWEAGPTYGTICCGYAGRAYSLLALAQLEDDSRWSDRAAVLAERAAHACQSAEMVPNSLYHGDLGVAVLASELAVPKLAAQPFFATPCRVKPRLDPPTVKRQDGYGS